MNNNNLYLITGNRNKLKELVSIFPDNLNIKSRKLDIQEIQSLDPYEIIRDKLSRAYDLLKVPVIAEDVSAELACLNGLPGPFVKYFEQKLGKGALWKIAKHYKDNSVTIRCAMGYYDGLDYILTEGRLSGKVVKPRGEFGFGFDFVLVPDGESRTVAQMGMEEKNKISWRALAAKKLLEQLQDTGKL